MRVDIVCVMDPLPLLCDLVAANSINPSLVPGAPGEAAAAAVAADALARAGLDVVWQDVVPGRRNVIGVLDASAPGPTVMLCGHLDTVGVDGMVDPFVPRVEAGRLYGRGAQDMKGGVAAMIAAAAVLQPRWTRGRLVVAGVIDEEYLSLGAEALVREWRADAAIVTEPTDLTVAIGHKGFAWIEIETHGRAAHGSRPEEGRDAIAFMGRVLGALESIDADLRSRPPVPYQGTGSVHASIIAGGRELSVYPDRCLLQLERRTVSGENGLSSLHEIDAYLDSIRVSDRAFRATSRVTAERPPYCLAADHPLARAMMDASRGCGAAAGPTGMSFWTDAAILGEAGIPSLLFGPGGAGLHSVEEYVLVEDVATCRDALVAAVSALLASGS